MGALGSSVAAQLGRAGVGRLTLLDAGQLEAGNLARHHGSLDYVGWPKTAAMAAMLAQCAPMTDVRNAPIYVGVSGVHRDRFDQHQFSHEQVASADVVIDATAAPSVTRYLAALAHAGGKPFVHVSAIAGAWGGTVVRIDPAGTPGCWACLEHHRADGSTPVPPADPAGTQTVRAVGCVEPTFTGSAADLDCVSSHASRVVLELLSATTPAEPFDSERDNENHAGRPAPDVFVAALRDGRGMPVPISWQSWTLAQHPQCPLHADRAAAHKFGGRQREMPAGNGASNKTVGARRA